MQYSKTRFNFALTDVETLEAISKLPKKHQSFIGRIVWWDWFGQRLVADRTTKFDHWLTLSETDEPSPKALMKSLMKLGYPEDLAWGRVRQKGQSSK